VDPVVSGSLFTSSSSPASLTPRSLSEESESEPPIHDPILPDFGDGNDEGGQDEEDSDSDSDSSDSDLGIKEAGDEEDAKSDPDTTGSTHGNGLLSSAKQYKQNIRDLHRKHRGLMQWKPARNVQFAKDEAKIAARKFKNKFSMQGREPTVETETGS